MRYAAAQRRPAFTVLEMVLAMTLLVVVMTLVAQAASWALIERGRLATRQEALEAAGNLLESARATPWDTLTPEWAAGQQLPESWVRRQPDGKLQVRVEPEPAVPRTRRVTVALRWDFREGMPPQEVRLETLFSARDTAG
jgi:hypothetical protein